MKLKLKFKILFKHESTFHESRAFSTTTWGSNQHHVGITQYLIFMCPHHLNILHVQHQASNDGSIWYPVSNAQGSRLIIVVVQLGAVKIYVTAVETLRKKERQDETWFTTKIDGFLSFIPRWMLIYFFAGCNLTLCMAKLRVLVLYFSYFTDNSIVLCFLLFKNISIPIYCFLRMFLLVLIIIFWVQSYIICLICLPHFLLQRFLMIMAFF
jgi:hypothetical protein